MLKNNYPEDLSKLSKLLSDNKIPHVLQAHQGATKELKKLIGYCPMGNWQIIIKKELSVIRGMCSWGMFEIYRIAGQGRWSDDPERFGTEKELADELKIYYARKNHGK